MTLSIKKKLAIVFTLGLLALGAIGYILYTENPLHRVLPEPNTTDFTYIKAIGSIRSILKDMDAAELSYGFSGNENSLDSSRDASTLLLRIVAQLKSLSQDTMSRLRTVEHLEELVRQRILFVEEIAEAHAKKGGKAAAALIRTEKGKQLSEEISTLLSTLEQDGLRTSAYYDLVLAKGVKKGVSLIVTGYGAVLFIIFLAILLIGRELAGFHQTRGELQELRERFQLFSDGLKDTAQITLDRDGAITSWPPAAERLQGFSESAMLGGNYANFFPEEDVKLGKPVHCLKTAALEGRFEQICSRLRKDGSLFQAHTVVTPLWYSKNKLRGFSVVFRDVTEQRRTEELLKKLSLTVEQAGDLVVITDRTGRVEFVNKAVEDVTGFTREEFISGGLGLLQMNSQDPALYRSLWESALSGRSFHAEMTAIRKNGELIFLDQGVTPIKDGAGNVTHAVFTGSDLTPIKHMRDKLDYLASYDALTGLPNRDLLARRLNRELTEETASGKSLAVLTIDIDRFKYLNEIYGLEAGNKVLQQVAESLSVSVNKGDTVGRLGSDEFGIVLHDVGKPADAVLFVKMIMKNVPQIVMSGGQEISVTLAIGIAVYPADGRDALTLMKNADTALSKAKELGRNRYQFYTPDMNEGITELVFMERSLSEALKNKEYVLAYQPYYHLSTRAVAGSEALLRWNNEEFGIVSPAKFIPMLEETGMITDVGNWVLRTACSQLKEWTKNGMDHLPVSVNISPSQFRHEYLVETVENTVRELGIAPQRLTLEVTESTFMKDQDFAVSVLKRLKNIGVSIAIDDFGTGYSSLSYLKKFPVDMIKIDQSFVKDVAADPDTTSLVTAIISMAHSLNLKTIAEGVETEEQWKILRLLKCDLGQGFYFSLAVPPGEFEQLVK